MRKSFDLGDGHVFIVVAPDEETDWLGRPAWRVLYQAEFSFGTGTTERGYPASLDAEDLAHAILDSWYDDVPSSPLYRARVPFMRFILDFHNEIQSKWSSPVLQVS